VPVSYGCWRRAGGRENGPLPSPSLRTRCASRPVFERPRAQGSRKIAGHGVRESSREHFVMSPSRLNGEPPCRTGTAELRQAHPDRANIARFIAETVEELLANDAGNPGSHCNEFSRMTMRYAHLSPAFLSADVIGRRRRSEVPGFVRKLAPRAGFEPATLRLTASGRFAILLVLRGFASGRSVQFTDVRRQIVHRLITGLQALGVS
jgi:hypothetical protein